MRALMLLTALTLVACGSAQKPAEEKPPMPVSDTVLAPAINTLDKARAVQGAVEKEQDKIDAATKDAE
jgi:hypothetical protein